MIKTVYILIFFLSLTSVAQNSIGILFNKSLMDKDKTTLLANNTETNLFSRDRKEIDIGLYFEFSNKKNIYHEFSLQYYFLSENIENKYNDDEVTESTRKSFAIQYLKRFSTDRSKLVSYNIFGSGFLNFNFKDKGWSSNSVDIINEITHSISENHLKSPYLEPGLGIGVETVLKLHSSLLFRFSAQQNISYINKTNLLTHNYFNNDILVNTHNNNVGYYKTDEFNTLSVLFTLRLNYLL